jgi:hypothetical protein
VGAAVIVTDDMRSSPAGSCALRLAVAFACLVASSAHAEDQGVLLFDTEMTPIARQGQSGLSEAELAVVPAALGVGASREDCVAGVVHWLTPTVASRALGSFTRDGAEQALVSVRFRRCDDVEESPLPGALVLYEGSEALVSMRRRANVYVVQDVDLDGLLEAVLITDEFGQGSVQRYASLWAFGGGEPRLVYDFGEVFADYCGSYLAHDDPITHTRVTYEPVPGELPRFEVVSRTSPCRQ